LFTVFAGQDKRRHRSGSLLFHGIPALFASIALLRDGKVVHMMHRSDIEHREAADIAAELKNVFDTVSAPNQSPFHSLRLSLELPLHT